MKERYGSRMLYDRGPGGHLHVPVRAFDMEQFCRMDGRRSGQEKGRLWKPMPVS